MSTLFVSHSDCLNHVTPSGHPEQVARLQFIIDAVEDLNLGRLDAPLAEDAHILSAHPERYLEHLKTLSPSRGSVAVDADTHMSAGSLNAAYRAVGGVIEAVDQVIQGASQNAFVAVRPPGHHAETATTMGFCFFGNVAIGAKHALDHHGLTRVAVVDFDVHHGNGTQDLLWDEARALTITSHQSPLWPGTGTPDENGAHDNVLNVPLPPRSGGDVMRKAYEDRVFPRLEYFKPEMIFVSAGFDAHEADPLAELRWDEHDFVWITKHLMRIADRHSQGRLVSVLEGGYDLAALARSVRAHVKTLSGDKPQ